MNKSAIGLAIATALIGANASAENYPSKEVSIIAPFAAGTVTDQQARLLSQFLSTELGKPFIVENAPGAEGLIAARRVINAPADGQTLTFSSSSLTVVQAALDEKKFADVVEHLKPVCLYSNLSVVLWVPVGAPYDTLEAMLAQAKAGNKPLRYSYSAGTARITSALLQDATGMAMTGVPYTSTMEALTAVATGEVDMIFNDYSGARALHDAGKLKPLMITSTERNTFLPEVPTGVELGYPSLEVKPWTALFAPADTDEAVMQVLSAAMTKAMESEEIKEAAKNTSANLEVQCGDDLRQRQLQEIATYSEIAKKLEAK